MDKNTLAQIIANAADARKNCVRSGNEEWESVWTEVIRATEAELPRGSGFDSNPGISVNETSDRRIVIHGSYHGMDEHGSYEGWSDYSVYVWPTFSDIRVSVRGGGRHRDYIGETFYAALVQAHDANAFRPDLKPAEPTDKEAIALLDEYRNGVGAPVHEAWKSLPPGEKATDRE